MDVEQLKSEARGKWPSICDRLGIEVGNGKHGPCPICGGKDRYRFDDKGDGLYYCNQCGAGDGFSLIQKVLGIDFKESLKTVSDLVGHCEPQKYQREKKITPEYFREILKKSKRTNENDIVHNYLKNRGLNTIPDDIWTTRKCWEPETRKNQSAMLAIFRLPSGEAVTIHRTYLSKESTKLQIDSPKKIMPGLKKMNSGAVRLFDHNGTLGISEGIETAIAVYETMGIPCWAALTSTLLESWEPPIGVKSVIVYGDNDKNYSGQKAAYVLANRLLIQNKLIVDVEIPEKIGNDFLDEMRE